MNAHKPPRIFAIGPCFPTKTRGVSGIVQRQFFFIEHFIKDMRIAHEEAEHMGRDLPGLELVRGLYQQLLEQGYARNGTQALFKLYER